MKPENIYRKGEYGYGKDKTKKWQQGNTNNRAATKVRDPNKVLDIF